MSSTLGAVRVVRVEVEPIEVELDDDGAIQWTSLQTAFPGCSGLYYKGLECRGAVKFDGKRFLAPGGAWNDRNYYVSLGGRCHQPFGSYENASKQFERSVTAVQRMLGSTTLEMPFRRSMRSSKSGRSMGLSEDTNATITQQSQPTTPVPMAPIEKSLDNMENIIEKVEVRPTRTERPSNGEILTGIQERERQLIRRSTEKLSPIEQQFIDLARISTGKDTIIDGQREELRTAIERLDQVNKKFSSLEKELEESRERLGAQEEELGILRAMSHGQINTNQKVGSLSSELLHKDEELSLVRAENAQRIAGLSLQIQQLQSINEELKADLLEASTSSDRYRIEAHKLESDVSLMTAELNGLREIRDVLQIEAVEQAVKWKERYDILSKTHEEHERLRVAFEQIEKQHVEIQELAANLTEENTRLISRNRELTERIEIFEREIDGINQKWRDTINNHQQQADEKRESLEKEVEGLRRELEEVQTTLSTVAKDAATNAQRASELEHSRDELRRLLDTHEYKNQEPLKRQIRTLSEELNESQERCKQLNTLVSSLTTDARNSHEDVTDFYYGTSRI